MLPLLFIVQCGIACCLFAMHVFEVRASSFSADCIILMCVLINGSYVISCIATFCTVSFFALFFSVCLLSSFFVVIWAMLPDAHKWMDGLWLFYLFYASKSSASEKSHRHWIDIFEPSNGRPHWVKGVVYQATHEVYDRGYRTKPKCVLLQTKPMDNSQNSNILL